MHTSKFLGTVVVILFVVALFLVATPLAYAANCVSPYTVGGGETWITIVYRCGVSYTELKGANPNLGEVLAVGDQVILPGVSTSTPTVAPTSTPTATATPTKTPTPTSRPTAVSGSVNPAARSSTAFLYDVQPGDNWNKVARKYNMTLDQLYSFNNVLLEWAQRDRGNRTQLEITDTILIPGINGETIIAKGSVYTIRSNESWAYVAKRAGLSIATLQIANPALVRSRDIVYVGDAIYVPTTELATSNSSAPPPSTSWRLCPNTYASRLQAGNTARITDNPPLSNRVRKLPSQQGAVIGSLAVGERMLVLDGPVCGDEGWIWWWVQSLRTGLTGWTSEGGNGERWIEPYYAEDWWLDPTPRLGGLLFCAEADFLQPYCVQGYNSFPSNTKRIYASWSFANIPSGSQVTRRYTYLEDGFSWSYSNTTGSRDLEDKWRMTSSFGFVWIYFDAQEGTLDRVYGRDIMRPGRYSVEFFLNGVYQNVGYFTIR